MKSASMQGIGGLMDQFLQTLSAGGDIPAPRFLGQAPGGLNATGKGDLVNYYDGLHSKQVIHILPQLNKLLPVLTISALGEQVPVEIKFRPLLQLSEDQRADLRTKDLTNILNTVTAGIGDDRWAVKESLDREVFLNDPAVQDIDEFDPLPGGVEPLQDGCGPDDRYRR
jgi:phage-related protein (TIGR01555 family)